MAGDVPLLDRLARLAPVSAASAASLVERLAEPNADPVIGPLFGTDEDGDTVVNPLVPAVLQALAQKEGLTCYAALLEGLTGIWNASVRAAVVERWASPPKTANGRASGWRIRSRRMPCWSSSASCGCSSRCARWPTRGATSSPRRSQSAEG